MDPYASSSSSSSNNSIAPTVNLGGALQGLTSDPEWFKKYAIAGVMFLVPLVGPLIVMGWARRVFEQARQGDVDSLPAVDFGGDLSLGVAPFTAVLNLMLPLMLVMMLMWAVGFAVTLAGSGIDQATDGSGAGGALAVLVMVAIYGLMFVGMIAMNLIMPEIQRRGYNGELAPLLSPGVSFRAITRNPMPYFMTVVGLFVARMLGGIGVLACYFGMFLTMPMGMAVAARVLAQWDAVVEQSEIAAGERPALG